MSDGGTLVPGTLWWSPASGKMYIYYSDTDSSQWVVTNPTTTQTGPNALDALITNDGSGPDYISLLPVPANQTNLWLEPTKNDTDWQVGDVIEMYYGAPEDGTRDTATIVRILPEENFYLVKRSDEAKDILHGASAVNLSRSYFVVTTATEHNLFPGDMVTFSGAVNPANNGEKKVTKVGECTPATFTATVIGGEVTSVSIDTPGSGYEENFYLNFVGGGGLCRGNGLIDSGFS